VEVEIGRVRGRDRGDGSAAQEHEEPGGLRHAYPHRERSL
jgi:hypothetical protein